MNAETAHLFRHVLLRDAAYQLQLPGDRAKLHALVCDLLMDLYPGDGVPGAIALELAEHARRAQQHAADAGRFAELEVRYLWVGARHLADVFSARDALRLIERLEHHPALEKERFAQLLMLRARVLFNSGDVAGAAECYRIASDRAPAEDRLLRANALSDRGSSLSVMGRIEEAEDNSRRALAQHRALGNLRGQAKTLMNLGVTLQLSGRPSEGRAAELEALAIYRQLGDASGEARALTNIAIHHWSDRNIAEAESTALRALEIHVQTNNRLSEALQRANLAHMYVHTGRLDEAERHLTRALAIGEETGLPGFGNTLSTFAEVLHRQGRLTEAELTLNRALAIHRANSNPTGEASALHLLAEWRSKIGQLTEAEMYYLQALAIDRQVGHKTNAAAHSLGLGILMARTERMAEAMEILEHAVAVYSQLKRPYMRFISIGCKAIALVYARDASTGRQLLDGAEAGLNHLGDGWAAKELRERYDSAMRDTHA